MVAAGETARQRGIPFGIQGLPGSLGQSAGLHDNERPTCRGPRCRVIRLGEGLDAGESRGNNLGRYSSVTTRVTATEMTCLGIFGPLQI